MQKPVAFFSGTMDYELAQKLEKLSEKLGISKNKLIVQAVEKLVADWYGK